LRIELPHHNDRVKVCPDCGAVHHATCWKRHKGCSFQNCPSKDGAARGAKGQIERSARNEGGDKQRWERYEDWLLALPPPIKKYIRFRKHNSKQSFLLSFILTGLFLIAGLAANASNEAKLKSELEFSLLGRWQHSQNPYLVLIVSDDEMSCCLIGVDGNRSILASEYDVVDSKSITVDGRNVRVSCDSRGMRFYLDECWGDWVRFSLPAQAAAQK
jgi:hypothetical protein